MPISFPTSPAKQDVATPACAFGAWLYADGGDLESQLVNHGPGVALRAAVESKTVSWSALASMMERHGFPFHRSTLALHFAEACACFRTSVRAGGKREGSSRRHDAPVPSANRASAAKLEDALRELVSDPGRPTAPVKPTPAREAGLRKGGEPPRVTTTKDSGEVVSPVYTEDELGPLAGKDASDVSGDDEAWLISTWGLNPESWAIVDGSLIANRWASQRPGDAGVLWLYQFKARLRLRPKPGELPGGWRRGEAAKVNLRLVVRRKAEDLPWVLGRAGMFYPDPQVGFWWGLDNELHTIHDERCMDLRNQVLADLRACYGMVHKTVCAGDTLDNAYWSRFLRWPAYTERTLQPSLDRTTQEFAELRAIVPNVPTDPDDFDGEHVLFLDGNHDNPRLLSRLIESGMGSLVGVRQGGTDPSTHPVMSVQHLTRMDDYAVQYVEPFPQATAEYNRNLGVAHGPAYSSKKLGTPLAILAQARRSMLHGHTHREEMVTTTLWTPNGPRCYTVASPGTFSRTDLVVPSSKSKPTSRGVPAAGTGTEDWQQGFFVVLYDADPEGTGEFALEHVRIWNGRSDEPSTCFWRGRKYESTVDADGNPL